MSGLLPPAEIVAEHPITCDPLIISFDRFCIFFRPPASTFFRSFGTQSCSQGPLHQHDYRKIGRASLLK